MKALSHTSTAALLVGHCAGMLDLVALPVWIGALVGWYRLDPQQAGLLASLFLGGQVVSSLLLAPRFSRLAPRPLALAGFGLAGLSFFGVTATQALLPMALLHFAGGVGAGCALSITHGTMGRSANPHRLFAHAGLALAVFGILMLGAGSALVQQRGGAALFLLFSVVMAAAVIAAWLGYPRLAPNAVAVGATAPAPLGTRVWLSMLGMGLMALAQATMFSFAERLGSDRGYAPAAVTAVLVGAGIVNLAPAPLAAWLQHRLRAERVVIAGPLLHGAAVLAITQLPLFLTYAALLPMLIALVVFTHIFLFGLLARLDPSGRAVAATPAMVMIGAAIGPVAGGTIVKLAGYGALGIAVAAVGGLSALAFVLARREPAMPAQARAA